MEARAPVPSEITMAWRGPYPAPWHELAAKPIRLYRLIIIAVPDPLLSQQPWEAEPC